MSKVEWKAGNMLYPLPAVLVTCTDEDGRDNVLTVAWAGTICTNPPMLSISVRPERFSYDIIRKTGEFVVNLTTEELAYATDYCGVKSGRDVDKFSELNLHKEPASFLRCPLIKESPVNIECKVAKVEKLGSHHMFIADVVSVHVDDKYMQCNSKFDFAAAKPIVYAHGEYFGIGKLLGNFGYSVKKNKRHVNKTHKNN